MVVWLLHSTTGVLERAQCDRVRFHDLRHTFATMALEYGGCVKRMDVDTFLETVRRYTDATTITKRMVAELIEYIIHYNCIGAFEVPDRRKIPERDILLETRKGVALSYAPAV